METETEIEKSEPAAILGEDAAPEPARPMLSQPDYRPTPYKQSVWEIVGEVCKVREFISMTMPVIRDERLNADPMFAVFDGPERSAELEQDTYLYASAEERAKLNSDEQGGVSEAEIRALKEQHQLELQAAVVEAYERGKTESQAESAAQLEALKTDLSTFLNRLNDQWQAMAEQLEKRSVELALKVSQKILRTTAEAKPEYIIEVIREALKHLGAAKPVRIRVSPDDYEFLEVVGAPLDISAEELGVTYQIDESIKAGCVVETDFGDVDLDLDRMWTQVRDSLYEITK